MYISQAYKGLHDWWRYLIGIIISLVGIMIFSLPHAVAILFKQFSGEVDLAKMKDTNYLMSLFESNTNLIFMLLPFFGGLIGLFVAFKFIHNNSIQLHTTSRKKIDWSRFWFLFLLWGILSSGMVLIDYFFISPENYVLNFKLVPFLILCVIAIVLVPLQTSFEEFMFRGYLMQGIGVLAKNKFVPLIVTSAVFGLLHISNPEVDKLGNIIMVYYIGTGLFLGILTLMDEGIELALGFHAANNLFTALLVTADWTAFQTHSILKDTSNPEIMGFSEIFVPVFVIFPILLLVLAKKYNWSNWKEKLFGKVHETDQAELINSLGNYDTKL